MGKWVGCQILSLLRCWVEWWDGTYVNFLIKSPLKNPQGIITNANNVCLIAADNSHEFKLQCKWLKLLSTAGLSWLVTVVIHIHGGRTSCVKPNISCLCACAGHVRRPPRRRTYAFQPQNGTSTSFVSVGKAEVGVLPHEFLQIPSLFTWTLCRPVTELVVRRLRFFLWKQV